ncbi:MAG: bifunctional UDP-N-acetylglucosamine diphosphorylase/glucosamine-1-phosphate N-acetyltransferase GlmU [Acidobacteria bacterium]|nr:bifunctional UDP-N-acetylglucosamine diphosphorylase/glucosamine-1-phosphate N-acetyltransferase GlmU [Acidobacteriota bacterium]MCA1651144.1 bifunctional UDP-N-acetylglucosamine diphosphorylase/glucosamine-1-phosphate N-acetyltransferase GlmU [Acidobacteriota bacterium]
MPTHLVILAAGKGTRMRSTRPKVLHTAAGLPLIEHVLRAGDALAPESTVVVVGYQAADVQGGLAKRLGLRFASQEPQLGTGHALLQAEPFLPAGSGTVVLLSGDVPLLRPQTLVGLVRRHAAARAAMTVLSAEVDRPDGYGRIVRNRGSIAAIVEHKDATGDERRIREINSGIYAFDLPPLFEALRQIGSANAQGEFYLPDLVRIYRGRGMTVETLVLDDPREILGVNSRSELAEVAMILKSTKNDELMASGVTLADPATAFIGPDVVIGADTVIQPGVYIEGRTRIGSGCQIHSGVRIVDSVIGDGVVINNFCVITESSVDNGARIGPFAHIRPQSEVAVDAHVGNFVELKKTRIGRGSKANHLSYLGDATIGERVNVGAGTITCNYDGAAKHPTVIEDGAFIGSDTQLIAPVRVGRGAYVAAGSSITEDVPPEALAISRGKQVNKEGWVAKKKSRA